MVFSDTVNNLGIVQQTRSLMGVDSTQWPTYKIVNSVNNWLDTVAGYAIASDRNFDWDDTNHTKLPIGTTNLVANQAEYSFLSDEQGNPIITLTRIDVLDATGNWTKLQTIDDSTIDQALDEFENVAGTPKYFDKIADNIVKLYPKPASNVTSGLKFYFQRAGSYFTASDTTKQPGVAPMLHRGFVIAAAYDGAMSLMLPNLEVLSVERSKEEAKMIQYFAARNNDEHRRLVVRNHSTR